MMMILGLLLLIIMEQIQLNVLMVISLLLFLYVTLRLIGMNYMIIISQSLLELNHHLKIVRLVSYNKRELIIYQFIIVYSSI